MNKAKQQVLVSKFHITLLCAVVSAKPPSASSAGAIRETPAVPSDPNGLGYSGTTGTTRRTLSCLVNGVAPLAAGFAANNTTSGPVVNGV